MSSKPRIAVLLDENTSAGGTRYEASKAYFTAISDAGGLPFGVPFLHEVVDVVIRDFDGLMCVGGRFAYPENWYVGAPSGSPPSERVSVERRLVEGYLECDKPTLGICAGMQLLGCINGCRMTANVQTAVPNALQHDARGSSHEVALLAGSRLANFTGASSMIVNSLHREAIVQVSPTVVATARASDGVIEAIEVRRKTFALGLQWHQEHFAGTDHPGNGVFRGFIAACRQR